MSFLLANLGSMLFWVGYILISIIVGILLMRYYAPFTTSFIRTGEVHDCCELHEHIWIMFLNFVFWPLILFCMIFAGLLYLIFYKIVGPGMKAFVMLIDKLTPNVKINMSMNDEKE